MAVSVGFDWTLGEVLLPLQFLPTSIIALVHHSGIFTTDAI